MRLTAPIAAGDLIDRITILEIKTARIADPAKLANVRAELAALEEIGRAQLPASPALAGLKAELREVNEALWEIEDRLRELERRRSFDSDFVEAARSVYRHNDRRAAIKRAINREVGSDIVEEKSYAPY